MLGRIPKLLLSSIRGRLALVVLAVAIPAGVLVAVLTKRAYDAERAVVSRQLMATTRAVAALVDRKFDASEALLRGLASLPALDNDDLHAFETRARALATDPDEWIVLLDREGQQLINTRLSPGAPLPRATLQPELLRTLESGRHYVSDVMEGAAVKAPVLTVSIPVLRGQELRYILTLAMFPTTLARATAIQEISDQQIVVIVDRNGIVATRSRGAARFVGKPATQHLVSAAKAAPEGVIETVTLEGIPTLSAFSRSPATRWIAAIGAPREALYASARNFLREAVLWCALIVALAGMAAWWLGRTVVGSMEHLLSDTAAVGEGRVPEARATGLHETDQVALALRRTAGRLALRERELTQLNATLEERVASRTRELDRANAALTTANRDLQDFAHVASHDLREPLRSMMAFTDILHDDNADQLDESGRKHLARVRAAAQRLSALLEAILAYSKASAAPLASFEVVDLDALFQDVQQDVALRIRDTEGRIEAGPLGLVRGDRRQLHQLLMNLIGNALKFHRLGVPPVVKVSATTDGGWRHVIVEDNGIGFDPADAEKIFAPFERLNRSYEGSGVGLAIVRRIAERHGGTVRATSTPGVGSRFEILLPAEFAAAA